MKVLNNLLGARDHWSDTELQSVFIHNRKEIALFVTLSVPQNHTILITENLKLYCYYDTSVSEPVTHSQDHTDIHSTYSYS